MTDSKDTETKADDHSSGKPRKWWQWMLIYPAVAVALITALPQWFSAAQKAYEDLTAEAEDVVEATDSDFVRFMKKNDECTRTPMDDTFVSPKNAEIWAVICSQTGDIFVVISTPSGEKIYSGVFVDEIADRIDSGKGIFVTSNDNNEPENFAFLDELSAFTWIEARANTYNSQLSREFSSRVRGEELRLSQATVVVCQSFRNDGTIVRRLRSGNICYDEVINGSNGVVISRVQVNCNTPCPQ